MKRPKATQDKVLAGLEITGFLMKIAKNIIYKKLL
jgi:hypothetical protein